MSERCVIVDHTTLYRWVQRNAPELKSGHGLFVIKTEPAISNLLSLTSSGLSLIGINF